MRRLEWNKILATATALVASLGFYHPAFAGQPSNDPVQAAFYACAGQPVSVESRLQALTHANWMIAADTAPANDLFELAFVSGDGRVFVPGETAAQNAALSGAPARPLVSRVAAGNGQKAAPARVPGGSLADVKAIVEYLSRTGGVATLYYITADASSAMRLLIYPKSSASSGYFLHCDLYLSAPLTAAEIVSFLPQNLLQGDLRKETKRLQTYEKQLITYSTTAGYVGDLGYIDATKLAPLTAHMARFGRKNVLASIVAFESRNLLLTD